MSEIATTTERPILFSGPMVKAILDGSKTQTRRVVKNPKSSPVDVQRAEWVERFSNAAGHNGCWSFCRALADKPMPERHWASNCIAIDTIRCPYGSPGDLLEPLVPIDGFDGKYAVSTAGVVYSRARGEWSPLKVWARSKGYPAVTLMDDGKKRTGTVHRLACEAFYGPPPSPAHQVRHLDGDPSNGAPWNLAWGTQEENWQDRIAHGNGIDGEKHHAAKFSDRERRRIRWAVSTGLCSQRHAARVFGVSQSVIGGIVNGTEGVELQASIPPDRIPRLTLRVEDVRVERVASISIEDCYAEGIEWDASETIRPPYTGPRAEFAKLWDSINGARAGCAWANNPWVWAVTFSRVEAAT